MRTILIAGTIIALITSAAANDDPYCHKGRCMPDKDRQQAEELLENLALEKFGSPPTPNHKWQGFAKKFLPVPEGCQEERVKVQGGTLVRVVCE